MQPSIPRQVAKLAGDKTFVGSVCAHGHNGTRYTANGQCVACANEQRPPQTREQKRRYRGLPEPTRPEPDHCECCSAPKSFAKHGLCLDHDHETGKFRGFICTRCNTAIGMAGDNPELLRMLAAYVESNR